MLHRVLTAMAAVLCAVVISGTADARPNKALSFYVEKSAETARPDSIRVSGAARTGKAKTAVHESRSGRNALSIARKYIGTNPTGWRRLWCAVFVSYVEKRAGRPGTGSALAKSYAKYGKPVPLKHAKPGDIVVLARKGGGHVGIASAPPSGGKILLVSGNSGGKPGRRMVTERHYPTSRIIAVRRVS